MVQRCRRCASGGVFKLALVVLGLVCMTVTALGASQIAFDSAFTRPASPFAVTECDSVCTSPSSVTLSLKILRSGDLTNTDTVKVSTRPSSDVTALGATVGDDYVALATSLVTFAPSETIKTIAVTIVSDGVYEDDELFEAVLDSPSAGVTLPDASKVAYIKIQDGGDAGIFAFSANSYSFGENSGTVQVKVLRLGGASSNVTVTYRLANPSQSTAIHTKSFLLLDTIYQIKFAENQREGFIDIKVINDAVYEAKEFFYLELASLAPTKASDSTASIAKFGSPRTAVVFIADDGDAGQFGFSKPFVFCREDNGSAVVSITRSLGVSSSSYLPVNLVVATVGVSGGTNASEGGSMAFDYLAKTEKLNWANGEAGKTFTVKIFNNNRYESQARAIKVRMTSVEGGASIGTQSEMWIYVIDDRDAGTISFKKSSYVVKENVASVSVEIIRTGITDSGGVNTYSSGAVSVNVATYGGSILPGRNRYDMQYDYGVVADRRCTHVSPCTAIADVHYTALASTIVNFADGETTKSVAIPILNNDLYEAPDLVFKIVLQNVTGGAHIGLDYEHPAEWYGYRNEYLALEKRPLEVPDNVGSVVTIQDDGDPAVILSKASVSVSEIGGEDQFYVSLNSAPTADVTVTITYAAAVLNVSPTTLTFTTSTWNTPQAVLVAGQANNHTDGILRSNIKLACVSSDVAYSDPVRTTLGSTGVVIAAKVFTQKPGSYETGNDAHEYLWSESSGVITAPRGKAEVNGFLFDDDHAGVTFHLDNSRYHSGHFIPDDTVAVRVGGQNATVGISLSSEPAGDVTVTLTTGQSIVAAPSTFTFTPASWAAQQHTTISAVSGTTETWVSFQLVRAFTSSSADLFYNSSDAALATLRVQRYPEAKILLDASPLTTRENDIDTSTTSYFFSLGSEPMYWEPIGMNYQPFDVSFNAEADTYITMSSTSPATFAAVGTTATAVAAGNASTSTQADAFTRIAAFRFHVFPVVVLSTGSHQVGAASLRLYRVSGGENEGLGGVTVGAVVANATDNWDEASLRATCNPDHHETPCSIQSLGANMSSWFPGGVNFANISIASAGEADILPKGGFNKSKNDYIASSGWIEIDVTASMNRFLAQQFELAEMGKPFSHTMTMLVYTRSKAAFVHENVNEVVLASREYSTPAQRPQLRVLASGRVNLALTSSPIQSHPGSAKAAIDDKLTSKLAVSSSFAMSSTSYNYPWWQTDLGGTRLIDEVVIYVKKKTSSATIPENQLPVTVWCFLSNTSLASNNNKGSAGWTLARSKAQYERQFNISSRSYTAQDSDNIVLRWRVRGEDGGHFNQERYVANYSTSVEAQFVVIQVEGENNIALNEVQVYQPAMAGVSVSLGAYMPSPSVLDHETNQISFALDQLDDVPHCDGARAVCRNELSFSSGDWLKPQRVGVIVNDDDVATGPRDILITHTAISTDPDFNGSPTCEASTPLLQEQCRSNLFNETSVKILRVVDDDRTGILFSSSKLEVEEGSGVYLHAPTVRRWQTVVPTSAKCSNKPSIVYSVALGDGELTCSSSVDGGMGEWQTCMSDPNATPLSTGSSWIMAGFAGEKNLSQITLTVPKMRGSNYIRQMSIWWNSESDINTSSLPTLFNISHGWIKLKTLDVAMKSSGEQVFQLDNLQLFPAKLVMLSLDRSYDERTSCVVAPRMKFVAFEALPFPVPTRGDLSSPFAAPPRESMRSRMHQYGCEGRLGVHLASEPIDDVIVSVVPDASSAIISVFDPKNGTLVSDYLTTLSGGSYESGERFTYTMPTALRFTPRNWKDIQELVFVAIDDNSFKGNRTITISHQAISSDEKAVLIPRQNISKGQVQRGFAILDSSLQYGKAVFEVTHGREPAWPHNWHPQWSSLTGSVEVFVVDDDLPGVTLSANEVIVSESAESGNYTVALDSSPSSNVVVKISYEEDSRLLSVSPLELAFTTQNWMTPQMVNVYPVPNDQHDAGWPLTIAYDRLVAKAKQPLLVHSVASTDANYNGIPVGGNEHDRQMPYVVKQGVLAIILDDDTGCVGEYTCLNGGVCMNSTYGSASASVCRCPPTFGMKDCSAVCSNARDCAFSRIELRLVCRPTDSSAICGKEFVPDRFVATIYRMLTGNEFTSSSGKTYPKLTLGPVSDVMYIVNATKAKCVDAQASSCVNVVVDFVKTSGRDASNPIIDKLNGYLETGSLQTQPLFVELFTSNDQYPKSVGATVAVWVFLGFCCVSVGGAMSLFSMRYVRAKRFHVTPQFADADEVTALRGANHSHMQ